MIPRDFVINTDRLILRVPEKSDIPFVMSATRYAGFNDGMLWEPPTTDEELLIPLANNLKAWDNQTAFNFTIMLKDYSFIGRISIRKNERDQTWDLGFWTHPAQQNQGYMTEAVTAIIEFGFVTLNTDRIIANYALWNKASERVLQKCGLVFSRYIPQGFIKRGHWVPENEYVINSSFWLKNKMT